MDQYPLINQALLHFKDRISSGSDTIIYQLQDASVIDRLFQIFIEIDENTVCFESMSLLQQIHFEEYSFSEPNLIGLLVSRFRHILSKSNQDLTIMSIDFLTFISKN